MRGLGIGVLVAVWVFAVLDPFGCSVITSFDRGAAVEDGVAFCSDGLDNDQNGLTDCQDWKCIAQPSCCDVPTVVLEDDLTSPSHSCASPCGGDGDAACAFSAEMWDVWGTPLPRESLGGFVSCKQQDCYDVGILSKASVVLEAGVEVAVT